MCSPRFHSERGERQRQDVEHIAAPKANSKLIAKEKNYIAVNSFNQNQKRTENNEYEYTQTRNGDEGKKVGEKKKRYIA